MALLLAKMATESKGTVKMAAEAGNKMADTDAAEVAVVVSALLLVVVSATIGAANALD